MTYSNKVGVFGVPNGNDGVDLFDKLLLLFVVEVHVPLAKASLARPVLYQDEPDLLSAKPV